MGKQPVHRPLANFRSRCSFAVRLIDAVTGAPPLDRQLQCWIEGVPARGVPKQDGHVVFMDLPEGEYTVCLTSKVYFDTCLTVNTTEIDPRDPVLHLSLQPMPHYPFSSGLVLIRGSVQDSVGNPLAGIFLEGVIQGKESVAAKLAHKAAKGDCELHATDQRISIFSGSFLVLANVQKDVDEVCRILASDSEKIKSFKLEKPLQQEFDRGSELRPIWHTRSDARGEWVMALPSNVPSMFTMRITASSGHLKWEQQIDVRTSQSSHVHLQPS